MSASALHCARHSKSTSLVRALAGGVLVVRVAAAALAAVLRVEAARVARGRVVVRALRVVGGGGRVVVRVAAIVVGGVLRRTRSRMKTVRGHNVQVKASQGWRTELPCELVPE